MNNSIHSAVADSGNVQGRDDGGPAFGAQTIQLARIPNGYGPKDGVTETMTKTTGGMTLRDYFAAKALPGVMNMVAVDRHELHELGKPRIDAVDALARDAYRLADAMLKARKP